MSTKKKVRKPIAAPIEQDPTLWLFLVELGLQKGNASEASRRVGWSPERGRRVLSEYPELRSLVSEVIGRVADSQLREWVDMHADARRTIHDLMLRADDERVKLEAAKIAIERIEGKVVQPVRDDTPQPTMDTVLMRFVASLHMFRGLTVAEAMEYAERNPDEVQSWGREKGLLPAGE